MPLVSIILPSLNQVTGFDSLVVQIAIDKEIKSKGSVNGLTGFPHVHNHMLRHTFATRMREAGADIKATADIMGHHEVGITLNTYTDASEKFKMKEISLLESSGKNLAV